VAVLALALTTWPGAAEMLNLRGRVVMEDGSQPGRAILVSRYCEGMDHIVQQVLASPKTGEYYIRLDVNRFGEVYTQMTNGGCHLEAESKGFVSTRVDLTDRNSIKGFTTIVDIVLSPAAPGATPLENAPVPHGAARQWTAAIKLLNAGSWAQAETQLRTVVQIAPNFTAGWVALGTACRGERNSEAARKAFERAVQLDPKRLLAYSMLLDTEIDTGAWKEALETSQKLMAADSKHLYINAYIQNAAALYALQDYDAATARINEAIRLDKHLEYPRTECILGLILEARGDLPSAGGHLRHYIEAHPRAGDVEFVKNRLANLGKSPPADLAPLVRADTRLGGNTEAPVPGGFKALATLARMKGAPGYADFFLEYCRAITEGDVIGASPTLESRNYIEEFATVADELQRLGDRSADHATVRLAMDTEEQRQKTARVLELFGWRLTQESSAWDLAPGDQRKDGIRQRFPSLFGIDELQLRAAITAGKPFQFEVPIESARLFGGATWATVLRANPGHASEPVSLFLEDLRFARTYTGLASADPDVAEALVSAFGLATLVSKYSLPLADYSGALQVSDGRVVVPGGPEAARLWSSVVGEDPAKAQQFLRALFEKDQGRLLPFYFDVSRADEAHRRFVMASPARFQAFSRWYRDSGPLDRPNSPARWQTVILQKMALDASGAPQFPGGLSAWTDRPADSRDLLFSLPLRPMAAVIQLEESRGARLDAGSVKLLAQHFEDWRHLTPYFENLPGLGAPEFQSLESFQASLADNPHPAALLGEFHSLVELIVLAGQAKSLDAAGAAALFGRVTAGLHSHDPAAAALAVLRDLSGGSADLDDAIPRVALRLSGARRASFERVKELQSVPKLSSLGESPDSAHLLPALSGLVYAALLDPTYQLVADDSALLSKHNFLPDIPGKRPELFADSALVAANTAPGSYLIGGFGRFREVTRVLDRRTGDSGGSPSSPSAAPDAAEGTPGGPNDAAAHIEADFRTSGRLVEVYATITDSRGRYIDDLKAGDFTILEEGQKRPPFAFEDHNDAVSIALLFDTTGSMEATLPPLKAAALKLIADLRPTDSVAVYGFNDRVSRLQAFTIDKTAASRAVLKAHPAGPTALYDALLRVSDDLAFHAGKKVILVFTDGDDNSSFLTAETAEFKAKMRGIPIYTIAQGEAIDRPSLLKQLADMSKATGGSPFLIRKPQDIATVFQKISDDLKHGYLVEFQPSPGEDRGWRRIDLLVRGNGLKVRAREGYYPE